MGIGYQALSLFDVFLGNEQFKNCKSVIEIGSQIIPGPRQSRARDILNKHNKTTVL